MDQFASWFCDRLAAYVARVDENPRSGRTFCATELDNLLAALEWVAEQGDLVRVGRTVSLLAGAVGLVARASSRCGTRLDGNATAVQLQFDLLPTACWWEGITICTAACPA